MGGCWAIAQEEVEDAGGDDGPLGNTRVDYFEMSCSSEVLACCLSATEVAKEPSNVVRMEWGVQEFA